MKRDGFVFGWKRLVSFQLRPILHSEEFLFREACDIKEDDMSKLCPHNHFLFLFSDFSRNTFQFLSCPFSIQISKATWFDLNLSACLRNHNQIQHEPAHYHLIRLPLRKWTWDIHLHLTRANSQIYLTQFVHPNEIVCISATISPTSIPLHFIYLNFSI